MDPGLAILLKKAPSEEMDYGFVMDCLRGYQNPRVKLNQLVKMGAIIRVKKGVYIFGESCRRRPFSKEVLANIIYGPSYVSLEWACQYYRLIPEKVTVVTSVTPKRTKSFSTPVGRFEYQHLPSKAYTPGMTTVELAPHQTALMATPEKALVDLLVLRRRTIRSLKEISEILFEDLRVEEEDLNQLDLKAIEMAHKSRPHSATRFLLELLS